MEQAKRRKCEAGKNEKNDWWGKRSTYGKFLEEKE